MAPAGRRPALDLPPPTGTAWRVPGCRTADLPVGSGSPHWGYQRIAGEVGGLGVEVSPTTVAKVPRRHPLRRQGPKGLPAPSAHRVRRALKGHRELRERGAGTARRARLARPDQWGSPVPSGQAGAVGPAGPAGRAGATGPSDGYHVSTGETGLSAAELTSHVTTPLPGGSYTSSAKVIVTNSDLTRAHSVPCDLTISGTELDRMT